MANTVLGISAFYHDSTAAIVRDGKILAAVQEERFSRKKNDPTFPRYAINFCLEQAFVNPSELDAVVYYENPLLTLDRVIKNFLVTSPEGLEVWEQALPSLLENKIQIRKFVQESLGEKVPLIFSEHHFSHAASAFYPSPFQESAILTLDGVGEWTTTSLGVGKGNNISLLKEIQYPHSLGLLYSAFTFFCGFKVNSGEYKLMGLAPYGTPKYAKKIKDYLIDIKPDGSFQLNLDYFGYLDTNFMIKEGFKRLFGGPPRAPETRITKREMDLASSVQVVLEDAILALAQHTRKITRLNRLVMAGGVALNCVANGKILSKGIFDQFWIQPAAGDAGGALGAALLASHQYFDIPRSVKDGRDNQKGSFLGPAYSPREVEAYLKRYDLPYTQIIDRRNRAEAIAKALAEGKIVGYMSGRMEFGPRSLGARSILGDPRNIKTQSTMNLKIKFRESFRPFAPSVILEDVGEYFNLKTESPYMLIVAPVKENRRTLPNATNKNNEDMIKIINQTRSDIPAVTHIDYSARIQTVNQRDNPDFYEILQAFKKRTGFGVLVNTSFNVRGEPITCSPHDCYVCFMRSQIDLLVMEEFLLEKCAQPNYEESVDWEKEYGLD